MQPLPVDHCQCPKREGVVEWAAHGYHMRAYGTNDARMRADRACQGDRQSHSWPHAFEEALALYAGIPLCVEPCPKYLEAYKQHRATQRALEAIGNKTVTRL